MIEIIKIDFTGSSRFEHDTFKRSEMKGAFTAESLANLLVEAWLPYFECAGCGRWKYCGLADPAYRRNIDPSRNYRCGVARLALTHFLTTAFPSLEKADDTKRSCLLDAAYFFTEYVFRSEVNVGNFLSAGMVNYYGKLSHLMASNLKGVRQHLGSFFDRMSGFSEFRLRERMLLVEGQSELRFVERLRSFGDWFPYDLHVVTYEGKSNRNSRLTLLVKRYEAEGYDVFVQGDADGGDRSAICMQLSRQHGIAPERVFLFTFDFEHGVGPKLMAAGIVRLLDLQATKHLETIYEALMRGESITNVFAHVATGLDFYGQKTRLAECMAEVLIQDSQISAAETLAGTEIMDFVAFANRSTRVSSPVPAKSS